ncbi:MAG TPA: hypothetical protein V6D35_23150 [Candidatus Sericytochromatia bacterium]
MNHLCPSLAFWLGVSQGFLPYFSTGSPLTRAITPLPMTMVQTHLCFRYAWTLARQLPGSAPSSSAF